MVFTVFDARIRVPVLSLPLYFAGIQSARMKRRASQADEARTTIRSYASSRGTRASANESRCFVEQSNVTSPENQNCIESRVTNESISIIRHPSCLHPRVGVTQRRIRANREDTTSLDRVPIRSRLLATSAPEKRRAS